MSANVYAGELGVDWGEHEFVFRPSFRALANLGDKNRLLTLLNRVQQPSRHGFITALNVLDAFHTGDRVKLDRLIGVHRPVRGRLRYVQGRMPFENVHALGARLLINAIVGDPTRKGEKGKGGKVSSFDPSEFVGVAQAHLGISAADAWDMTMIEFQRAMDAKYPPKEEEKQKEMPSEEEAQSVVAYIEQFRKRKGK